MRALIEPRDDVAFYAACTAEPAYDFDIFGGAKSATIACEMTARQRAACRMADVSLLGSEGLTWGGTVRNRPARGEALACLGPNVWLADAYAALTTAAGSDVAALIAGYIVAYYPTFVLPAGAEYRAWIAASCGFMPTIAYDERMTKMDQLTDLLTYVAYDWGWYPEWVGGVKVNVPHLTARSTTPDYVLPMRGVTLAGSSVEPLASTVRVFYNAGAAHVDRTDVNTSHPLVRLGITKRATFDTGATDATSANQAGDIYLADAGREQVSGTMPVRLLRSATGLTVVPSRVRPGQMVRLLTGEGPRDATIREVKCVGEVAFEVTVDNVPNRLDILLARAAKK